MKKFKDNGGAEWSVELTIGAAMRVRQQLGVNLLEIEQGDPPLLQRLGTDELLLAEVIRCILEPQFEAKGIQAEQVYDLFTGDVITRAADAFWQELADFFRSRRRNDRAAAVQKQAAALDAAIRAAALRIEGLDVAAEVEKAMSGGLPGGSE